MSNIKMSDVFHGKVIVDSSSGKVGGGCNEIGDDYGWIAHFGYSGDFTTQDSNEMATYASHAINNHDRMVEEIAELKDLVTLISLNSTFQTNIPHEAGMVDELLAKLQKGEE